MYLPAPHQSYQRTRCAFSGVMMAWFVSAMEFAIQEEKGVTVEEPGLLAPWAAGWLAWSVPLWLPRHGVLVVALMVLGGVFGFGGSAFLPEAYAWTQVTGLTLMTSSMYHTELETPVLRAWWVVGWKATWLAMWVATLLFGEVQGAPAGFLVGFLAAFFAMVHVGIHDTLDPPSPKPPASTSLPKGECEDS